MLPVCIVSSAECSGGPEAVCTWLVDYTFDAWEDQADMNLARQAVIDPIIVMKLKRSQLAGGLLTMAECLR